jgi:hypothetical protein
VPSARPVLQPSSWTSITSLSKWYIVTIESTKLSPGKRGGTSGNATLEKEKMWKAKKERKKMKEDKERISGNWKEIYAKDIKVKSNGRGSSERVARIIQVRC